MFQFLLVVSRTLYAQQYSAVIFYPPANGLSIVCLPTDSRAKLPLVLFVPNCNSSTHTNVLCFADCDAKHTYRQLLAQRISAWSHHQQHGIYQLAI